ncbi:PadR family transcriptional regulator [Caballeronia choica]|jgi:DNA-binding PadR family transcriptional regulator|uniref:PadR family transcriptional regulator n=1 Tax=Caballeronia choica TaxID=326476 RepID=A0A158EVQ7_9BURK|nr:PadR family transcriptional regulator [Caballeronia choica]SAL11641.1 PadR family transcriptional regulator [Caballeronia choica]
MFGRHRRHLNFESAAEHIPHGHGGHGGRGMRHRMFDSGHLRLVILDLIGETPRHGYDVIKALEARCGGLYSPSPGVVYPTLSLLEDQGFVTVEVSAGNKKRYTITDEGRAHLAENQAFLNAINARLAMARSQEAHGEASNDGHPDVRARSPELREAFHRLKGAVLQRVRAGDLDAARVARIREILTQAADDIDKL